MILIEQAGGGSRMLDKGVRTPCFTISNRAVIAGGYRSLETTDTLSRFAAENR
jgi:hypothetical protein